ncbi:MAG: cytoplasmic protein [Desulfobacterales bacterium]|nr:cytoplasmic protein [Desulfobacterales bacterium]
MTRHSHEFVETYEGLVGFGADRETDENTVVYYLQKFSDDRLMKTLVKRLSEDELSEIFNLMTRLLKTHLSEAEYHGLFLKEAS